MPCGRSEVAKFARLCFEVTSLTALKAVQSSGRQAWPQQPTIPAPLTPIWFGKSPKSRSLRDLRKFDLPVRCGGSMSHDQPKVCLHACPDERFEPGGVSLLLLAL